MTQRRSPAAPLVEMKTAPWGSPVAQLLVCPLVARAAQALEVAPSVRASLTDRHDVMHLIHQRDPAFLKATLTQRVLPCVAVTDTLPGSAIFLVLVRCSHVQIVLTVCFDSMFLAVTVLCQVGTSGISTGFLRFPWHLNHLLSFRHWHFYFFASCFFRRRSFFFIFSFIQYLIMYQHCSTALTFRYGMVCCFLSGNKKNCERRSQKGHEKSPKDFPPSHFLTIPLYQVPAIKASTILLILNSGQFFSSGFPRYHYIRSLP